MTPISGVNTGAIRPLTTAEKVQGAPKVQKSEEESRPLKPMMDEYIPEEKREPSGRYWMGKVYFDDPERNQSAKGTEKGGKKEERCVCDTDKVDREIEKLKKKRQELGQQRSIETDEAKMKDLERQMAQVERELSEKDNDTYRKQNSTYTQLG